MASDDVVSRVVPMEGTLRYLFDSYDADHDGWLTPANFALFLWDLKRYATRTRDLRYHSGSRLIARLLLPGSRWTRSGGPGRQMSIEQLRRCWAAVDLTHSGRVRFEQFAEGVRWLWEHKFAADGVVLPPRARTTERREHTMSAMHTTC